MAYPYITQADLESRVSPTEVRRILDDNSDGNADANAITRVLEDASAKVAGYLRGIYDLDTIATNPPNEVKRLTLDVAVAYMAQRHPERVRRDWVELMKQADKDLVALRTRKTNLDVVGSPEPASNDGGDVVAGDPDEFDASTYRPTFLWGTGDF